MKKAHAFLAVAIAVTAGTNCSKTTDSVMRRSVSLAGRVSIKKWTTLAGGDSAPQAANLSSYKMHCVTFSNTPSVASTPIASDGTFLSSLPNETPFGCFVLDSSNHKACLVVVEEMGSESLDGSPAEISTISLRANASLRTAIDCDTRVGKAGIKMEEIKAALSSAPGTFDPSSLHDNAYKMTCIPTGDAVSDAECKAQTQDEAFFFRYLKGTSASATGTNETVTGLSVWASPGSWVACGSVDVGSAIVQTLPLSFSGGQGTFGSWSVTPPGGACEAQELDPQSKPRNAYLIDQLRHIGGVWIVQGHEKYPRSDGLNGTCFLYMDRALSMAPDPKGAYDFLLSSDGNNGTDCPATMGRGLESRRWKFTLGMKKQDERLDRGAKTILN
jgi:hypothetical protein